MISYHIENKHLLETGLSEFLLLQAEQMPCSSQTCGSDQIKMFQRTTAFKPLGQPVLTGKSICSGSGIMNLVVSSPATSSR